MAKKAQISEQAIHPVEYPAGHAPHDMHEKLSPPHMRNVGEGERYGSILGGMGLILAGLSRRGVSGVLLGALGASLIQRGVTGHCALYQQLGVSGAKSDRPGVPDNVGVVMERSIVIHQPQEQVYAFWRHFPNLALAMKHVERVDVIDQRHTHWVASTAWGRRMEWDAMIINEHPHEMIAWESLPGAEFENAGSFHFKPEPHGNGTVVTVKFEYNPPGGLAGWLAEKLFATSAEEQLYQELARVKKMMESGALAEA